MALSLLAGCNGPVQYLQPFSEPREVGCSGTTTAVVEVTYLGAGGFLIRHRDDAMNINRAIMTGPFFSNPGILRSLLGFPIAPDPARIAEFLPPVGDVAAILIGHAHYDHLMDTIHVAESSAPQAILYGNDTMVHIVNARPALRSRAQSLEPLAGNSHAPGQWQALAGGGMRVMALRSEHAPQFLGIRAFVGSIDEDLGRAAAKRIRLERGPDSRVPHRRAGSGWYAAPAVPLPGHGQHSTARLSPAPRDNRRAPGGRGPPVRRVV